MRKFFAILMIATVPVAAAASSDDAWEEFRTKVDDTCRSLVEAPDNATITVEVNDFGSESYGAAIVTVDFTDGQDRMVCIYDKQTGDAELTAPFADAAS